MRERGDIEEKDTAEVLSRLFIKSLSGGEKDAPFSVRTFFRLAERVTRKCKFQIAFIRPAGSARRDRRRKDAESLRPTTDRNGSSDSTNSREIARRIRPSRIPLNWELSILRES